MEKIHKYVYGGLTSFDDMKKHSSRRFKEITKRLREEDKKRREKKNNERKWMQGMMDEEFNFPHHQLSP